MNWKPRPRLVATVMVAVAAWFAGCSEEVAGGSSEQGNAIELVVADPANRPVAGASIRLRPHDWVRGGAIADARKVDGRTDSLGRFRCERLPPGDYVVEAQVDSLVGAMPLTAPEKSVSFELKVDRGASVVLEGLDSGKMAYLRGIDRVPQALPDGRVRFENVPATALSVLVAGREGNQILSLPAPAPGTTRQYEVQKQTVVLDSASSWLLEPSRYPPHVVGSASVQFSQSGNGVVAQRGNGDGTWSAMPESLVVDSTQSGWFRYAGSTWTGAPAYLRWLVWPSAPRLRFGWEANGTDSLAASSMTNHGATLVTDTSLPYVRMDTTQWVDFGIVADTSIADGSLEFLFRPGPGFSSGRAYTLLGEESGRLSVGYLKGALFFMKSGDYTYRWVTTRPGQCAERRWYRILVTWGRQGMTISVNDSLRGWNADTTGYSKGVTTEDQRRLRSGLLELKNLQGIGIRSPVKLDGDIASIRLRYRQPVIWKDTKARTCPDSLAGDPVQRCGVLSSTNILERPTIY